MAKTMVMLSGVSVTSAGDINGDGCADLIIGANQYLGGTNKGRSYVVFGDAPPVLVNNSLLLFSGETVVFRCCKSRGL